MKIITTICTNIFLVGFVQAQIVIDRSDFGQFNDKLYYANDTTLGNNFSVGNAGDSIVWDFSGKVMANKYDSATFFDPRIYSNTPEESNIGMLQNENASYYDMNANGVKVIIPTSFIGMDNLQLAIASFPLMYGSAPVTDSVQTKKEGTPAEFNASQYEAYIDSLRVTIKITTQSVADGWGTLITPTHQYDALRVRNKTKADIKLYGKLKGFGVWTPLPLPKEVPDMSQNIYAWYAKGAKFSVAEAILDTSDKLVSFRYQVNEVGAIDSTTDSIPSDTIPIGLVMLSNTITKTTITPNPANQNISLQFTSTAKGNAQIEIVDITGKVIVRKNTEINTGNNTIEMNTELLQNGLYFAKITGTNIKAASKFVVQH